MVSGGENPKLSWTVSQILLLGTVSLLGTQPHDFPPTPL